MRQKSLKKLLKLIVYLVIQKKEDNMISLVMQHLAVQTALAAASVDLEALILIAQTWATCLEIFLATYLEALVPEDVQIMVQ